MSINCTLNSIVQYYNTIFTLKYTHFKIYVQESKWEKICSCVKSRRHLVNKLFLKMMQGKSITSFYFIFIDLAHHFLSKKQFDLYLHLKMLIFWILMLYPCSCVNIFITISLPSVSLRSLSSYLYLNLQQSLILSYYPIFWIFLHISFSYVLFLFL